MVLYNKNIKLKKDNPIQLSAEEELELIKKHNNGDVRATERLLGSMQHVLTYFASRRSTHSGSYDDLYQSALEGALKGINNFDPEKNVRLPTYVSFHIKNAMERFVGDSSRPVAFNRGRGPRKVHAKAVEYISCPKTKNKNLLSTEVIESISKELDVPRKTVEENLALMAYPYACELSDVEDHLAVDCDVDILNEIEMDQLKDRLCVALDRLDGVERAIVIGKYFHGKTFSELGQENGVSTQWAHKMYVKSEKQLRKYVAASTPMDKLYG